MASDLGNINNTTAEQHSFRPDNDDVYAKKIIEGRLYKMKTDLKTKKIIPGSAYDKIAGAIITKQK